jgi:hypothetical protein
VKSAARRKESQANPETVAWGSTLDIELPPIAQILCYNGGQTVMALNEISDLLGRIEDSSRTLRLVYPTPTWEDFPSLALDEIRFYGANSFQVMRRLRAMLADLDSVVPPERRAAGQQAMLRTEVTASRSFVGAWDLQEAQQISEEESDGND